MLFLKFGALPIGLALAMCGSRCVDVWMILLAFFIFLNCNVKKTLYTPGQPCLTLDSDVRVYFRS